MDSQTVLHDKKVVRTSIECIEKIIKKLDNEADIGGGGETVKKQFSIDDVINRPKAVLDSLIVYLPLVHNVDWYSSNWGSACERGVGGFGGITVRPERGVNITSSESREVGLYLSKLLVRTERFLKVMHFKHEDKTALITQGKPDDEEMASRTAPDLSMRYMLVQST